jgi:alkylation response protein AidB-like acyl-CoA dehydrogenase
MNLALTDEQEFLREAARGALSRFPTVAGAREALEGGETPDLWPTACEAGWPGLLISEQHGGAGLGAFDAMLVLEECGRVLAALPLLGHLPATALLDADGAPELGRLAAGELRAAWLPARPPGETEPGWTVDPRSGSARAAAPVAEIDGERAVVTGEVSWVPDAPGADVLVAIATAGGRAVAVLLDEGVTVEQAASYDATRAVGHVRLDGAPGRVLNVEEDDIARAWYLAQALLAAESVGAVTTTLEVSVAYAKERFTFGRAIGSYQAVKHSLTEILRRQENGRSLLYYAGWAAESSPQEYPLAASAARSTAGRALDYAARAMISVHGGIGATWEHDAPLFFRRAQMSRRLLGGTADATDRVAEEVLSAGAV